MQRLPIQRLPIQGLPILALAVAAAVLLAACGEPPPPLAPLGVFVLDRSAMVEALRKQGVPDPVARRHASELRVELDLREDGSFLLRHKAGADPVEVRTGTWARRGNRISITTRRVAGQPIDPPVDVAALLDGDRLMVVSGDGAGPSGITPEAGGDKAFTPAYVFVRR